MSNSEKVFVLLYPTEDYISLQNGVFEEDGIDKKAQDLFTDAIYSRYISKGYKVYVAQFKGRDIIGFDKLPVHKVVFTKEDINHFNTITSRDSINPKEWYDDLAQRLDVEAADSVVVGGYHLGHCVDNLTQAIGRLNKNVIIDPLVTNLIVTKEFRSSQINIITSTSNKDATIDLSKLSSLSEMEKYNIVSQASETVSEAEISERIRSFVNINDLKPKSADLENEKTMQNI